MKSAIATTLNSLLHGILRGLLRAWVLVVPLVLALSIIRMGQLAYFWPAGYQVSTSDLGSVLVQGLRFDLKVSAVAGFLLLLVLPWVSGKVQGRIAAGVAFFYVMLSLVNLHYFGFYKTPIDSLVFGLVEDDTAAVLQTIWQDFPVIWTLLLAAVLTVGSVALHRFLLARIQGGDLSARRILVARIEPRLQRFARGRWPKLLRHEQDTADLMQLTWLKVLEKLDSIAVQRPGDFFAYLRTVLLNALRETLRRHDRSPISPQADVLLSADSIVADNVPLDDWLAYEQALATLPGDDRVLVIMRFEFGMRFVEMAEELGESPDAIRMRVTRALARVAEGYRDTD